MNIEIITDDLSQCQGHQIFIKEKGRFINKGGFNGRDFSDDEIFELLGSKKYKLFEGGKTKFKLTKFDLYQATKDLDFYENNKSHLYR